MLSILFVFLGKDVRFNNNFSVLFAVDNDANRYRDFYRQQFGADDGLLMAIVQPDAVDKHFFRTLEEVTDNLQSQAYYQRILSPVNAAIVRSDAASDEVSIDPIFYDFDGSDLSISEKVILLRKASSTAGRLVSTHSDTFAILAQMPADLDSYRKIREPAEFFQHQIDAAFMSSAKVSYAGVAFSRIGILDLMHQDLFLLVPLTAIVVAFATFLIFRSIAVVIINSFTIVFSSAATLGLMGMNNDDINQLTITFPVLLMVIVVANGIHFFHRYFRELQQGTSPSVAVSISSERVAKAAFLSCFTTSIGFFALLTADMPILRSFGYYLGCGVLLAFVGLTLIIPACLILWQPKVERVFSFTMVAWVDTLVRQVMKRHCRNAVIISGFVFLGLGVYISSHAKYDYFLADMLSEQHPQVVAGNLADEHLSGPFPLEISLLGEPGDFRKIRQLRMMLDIERWLSENGFGEHALSLANIIRDLNEAFTGERQLPESNEAVAQLLLLAEGSSDDIVTQLVNFDYSHARIRINGPDRGATTLVTLEQGFQSYVDELTRGSGIQIRMTGEAPVAYQGMNRLARELMQSVLLAVIFIVITIQVVFRDIRLSMAAIFPNILPIIIGLVFYTLSGQALNPLPGIAFCIAIGIAVDDTVHLFARFNEELQAGKLREQAIVDAVYEVKGALFTSSFILTTGFMVFLVSGFSWNRDLGWLGASLIIIALIADLVYTPAFLSLTGSKKMQSSES